MYLVANKTISGHFISFILSFSSFFFGDYFCISRDQIQGRVGGELGVDRAIFPFSAYMKALHIQNSSFPCLLEWLCLGLHRLCFLSSFMVYKSIIL